MTNFLLYLYKLMLRLYPGRFYHTFGPEMAEVFAEKLHHAANQRALLMVFARELRHWPGNCLREHWAAQQSALNFPTYEKLSWRGTAVAALPYVLMAILFGMVYLVAELFLGSSPGSALYNTATAIVIGIFIATLAIAWWQSWPGWSVSWLGLLVCLMLYVFLPQLIFQVQFTWDTSAHLLQMIVSSVVPPLLLFGAFYWLAGRWPYVGGVVLLAPLGFSWVLRAFVPDSLPSIIFVLTWCWLAVVSVLMMRLGNGRWHGWFLGLAALVINLIAWYAGQFFWVGVTPHVRITQLIEMLPSELVQMLLPLMAILLLHALRRRLADDGHSALRHYHFLFWGIVGIIVACQTGQQFAWPYDLPTFQAGVGVIVTVIFLLSIVGISLGIQGLQGHEPRLLLLLLVLFPFLYQIETISLLGELFNWDSLNQYVLYETVRLGGRAVGLIWLGLAAWLLERTSPLLPDKAPNDAAPIHAS